MAEYNILMTIEQINDKSKLKRKKAKENIFDVSECLITFLEK